VEQARLGIRTIHCGASWTLGKDRKNSKKTFVVDLPNKLFKSPKTGYGKICGILRWKKNQLIKRWLWIRKSVKVFAMMNWWLREKQRPTSVWKRAGMFGQHGETKIQTLNTISWNISSANSGILIATTKLQNDWYNWYVRNSRAENLSKLQELPQFGKVEWGANPCSFFQKLRVIGFLDLIALSSLSEIK
jgi:hypothetical protein